MNLFNPAQRTLPHTPRFDWRLRAALALLGSALAAGTPQAAEWTVAPEVEIGSHYNDNARLAEGDEEEIEIWGGVLSLGALAQRRTERSTILVRPRLNFSEYPNDEDESSDDQYLDFRANSEGLRSQWDLVGNFSREQVIRGEDVSVEFPDPEIEDPDVGETGLLGIERRRILWRLRPTFSYQVTERTDAGIRLDYVDVSYDPELPDEALDFTNQRGELFLVRALAEDSRLRAALFATKFEADDIANESTAYGLRARYDRDISETFNVFFDVGVQETDIEVASGAAIDDSTSSFLFNAGFMRRWERTRMWTQIGRQVQPTGTGFLRETDSLRLNVRHQFQPRWFGEFGVAALRTESLDDTVMVNDRDYYQLKASLGYELTRAWSIETTVGHTFQDYDNAPGDADANDVYLTLRYAPRGKVWSR